jgi:hypothetical protein
MNNKSTNIKGEKKVQNKIDPKNKKGTNAPKKTKKKDANVKNINKENTYRHLINSSNLCFNRFIIGIYINLSAILFNIRNSSIY